MQAMNGLVHGGRKRGRIVGSCVTLALALCGLVVGPAVANAETQTYVAAGDSISFGYTQERFNVNFPNEAPAYFEEGPVNVTAKMLSGAGQVGKGLVTVNTACPGETSNGFIGENPALGGETSTEPNGGEGGIQGPGDWHPCAYRSLKGLPLHYSLGNKSQLEEILSVLKEGKPAHPVRLISLQIGANDELAALTKCAHEVGFEWGTKGESPQYGGKSPAESFSNCTGKKSATQTFPRILKNIGAALTAIDSVETGGGHYTGAIVLQGFYNPDTFVRGDEACGFCSLQGSDRLQRALNEEIELHIVKTGAFPNLTFANPFPKVNVQSQKVEQLETENKPTGKAGEAEQASICKYTEMCNPNVQAKGGTPAGKDGDIHPSLAGAKLLGALVDKAWLANPAK
jgi:hypothetical protein